MQILLTKDYFGKIIQSRMSTKRSVRAHNVSGSSTTYKWCQLANDFESDQVFCERFAWVETFTLPLFVIFIQSYVERRVKARYDRKQLKVS